MPLPSGMAINYPFGACLMYPSSATAHAIHLLHGMADPLGCQWHFTLNDLSGGNEGEVS